MTHALTLGGLLLTDSLPDDDHGFVLNILAEGLGFGVASGAREIITSLLSDGELVRITRFGNREVVFAVEITGPSLSALAHGEAVLRRELGRRNTLTWQPPDLLSVPTVFEVIASEMSQKFDDLDELRRRRAFTVTLTCAPFARSAEQVTVSAVEVPPSASTFTIDDCSSVSTWSAVETRGNFSASVPVVASNGGTSVTATAPSVSRLSMTCNVAGGGVSFTGTRYLMVDASAIPAGVVPQLAVTRTLKGVGTAPLVLSRMSSPGRLLMVWDLEGQSGVTSLTLSIEARQFADVSMTVFDVSRTNTLPQVSPRQQARVLEVGGTERTPASIHVASTNGTDALGTAIVHTCPEDGSGYSPSLRRWRVSGQATGDNAAAFSGKTESITGTGVTYEIPTSALPEGGYVLVARLARSVIGTANVAWSTATVFPDGVTVQGEVGDVEPIYFADVNGWNIVGITTLSLPSVRTKSGKVRIILQDPGSGGTTSLDEAWLFRVGEDCGLSITNTSYPNLWLDSPGLDTPVPTMWVGDGATRVHPGSGVQAMGTHVLTPAGTAVFTAALTDNPSTDATFYRRWHSNAAE